MTKLPAVFLGRPLAHRALHDVSAGRPENSLAAIQAAIDNGFGIEIDVQLTADSKSVVFHDYTLDRLTSENGQVRGNSLHELGRISLLGGDAEYIPSLPKVLELVAGRVPLLIEIKDQDGEMGSNVGPLEQAVADALRDYSGPVAVMSFNPHSVAAFAALSPKTPIGLTTSSWVPSEWGLSPDVCERLREIPDAENLNISFISHEYADLNRPRVAELAAAGCAILCWTVRSPEQEAQAREVADNITFEGYWPEQST